MPKPRKRFALWITAHILKILACVLVFAVIFAILWRVFISNIPPKEMKQLQPTAQLAEAYRTHGDDLSLFTQTQPSVTKAENNYGYFGVSRFVFIEQANQLQLVFRFNNSTLAHVQEDYALPERPARGDAELFDLSVVIVSKTVTEGGETVEQKLRLHPTSKNADTTALYTYVFFVFDNVEITSEVTGVFLDVYYQGDVNYDVPAYGTLLLYNAEANNVAVTLTRKEQKALKAFING